MAAVGAAGACSNEASCHAHLTMRKAANLCGFSRPVGETRTQPKLQQLVAKLRKRPREVVEVRAKAEGADRKEEVAEAKRRVQAARRALEDELGRIYQQRVAEHERYMERGVPYKALRYIRELAEAEQPEEISAVRLQYGRVMGNKREVLEEVAERFQRRHTKGSGNSAKPDRGWSGRCRRCSRRSKARPCTAAG